MTQKPDFSATRAYPDGFVQSVWAAPDGWPLRRYDWPQADPCGTILFLTGRGDMPEKYLETMAHWRAQGWAVTGFDWRGQGGSGRLLEDRAIGHIDRFETWLDDLQAFASAQDWARPLIVIGHSMGGHLVLRALAEARIAPDGVVLSAPMLGFETGPLPVEKVAALVGWAARRWPQRKAWPGNEKPALFTTRQQLLTHDDARYADEVWWRTQRPELVLGPPSLNWLSQAYASCMAIEEGERLERVTTPVLMIGTDGDGLVSPRAIRRIAPRLASATLHMYGKEARHELLREGDAVRDDALARIDAFLSRVTARS